MIIAARSTVTGTEPPALDLAPRAQVLTQPGASLAQPAQIDDALATGSFGGGGEIARQFPVALRVARTNRDHRVHHVVGDAAAAHRIGKALGVADVAGNDLDRRVIGPGAVVELLRAARQAAHPVPGLDQTRNQSAADIAGGTGHENRALVSVVHNFPL
jgi:hypothetical protein